ncbi:hypothetical protein YPPY64_2743, partial [Yersinia pestis PY-64]
MDGPEPILAQRIFFQTKNRHKIAKLSATHASLGISVISPKAT